VSAYPFLLYFHHVQICGVRSSLEGRYTLQISTPPLYELCVQNRQAIYIKRAPRFIITVIILKGSWNRQRYIGVLDEIFPLSVIFKFYLI
jgi:hypothetical protein